MAWLELSIELAGTDPATLEAVLEAAGSLAVTLRDGGDQPLLEPGVGETPLWRDVTVTALFAIDVDVKHIDELAADATGRETKTNWRRVEDRVWEREWLAHFTPQRFGARLWVIPGDEEEPDPGAANVHLDPGLAFGTGDHATTALCLEWLGDQDLRGQRVLDYGCGSGILAIAALKLGALGATAVDIDPQALQATGDNAERNGVAERLLIMRAPATDESPYHVVLANILAVPLIDMAGPLIASVAPGGAIALSGILRHQTTRVMDAFRPHIDWRLTRARGDWSFIQGVRVEAP